MNSSRLVGAFCLLFSLLFVLAADEAAAQVIDISQPVVVDPSVLRYPAEKRGIIDYYSFNQACRGESYVLLVVGNNVSLSYDTGVLSLLRTDLQGNLIDTIPKPLIPNLATPREKNFSLYGVVWSAPYFYLIGQWMENYGVYSDSLSYIRVTEDLEIVDQRPVAMMPRLMQFSLKFDAQDGVIWMGYEHHGLSLYKYDLSSNQVILNGLEPIPSDWVRSWATCQSNGWYLALRTDHNEDSIYNVYVAPDNSVTDLGYAISPPPDGAAQYNSFSMVPWGADSMAVCFFESTALNDYRLKYYFISRLDPAGERSMRTIAVPYLPGTRTDTEASFYPGSGSVEAVTEDNRFDTTGIAFYRFDLTAGTLEESGHLSGFRAADDREAWGYFPQSDLFLYFYRNRDGVYRLSFDINDPINTASSGPLLYRAQTQRQPTLMYDDQGLLLYYQQMDSVAPRLKSVRLGSAPDLNVRSSADFLDAGVSPYQPFLMKAGESKFMIWLEDLADYGPSWNGGVTFLKHCVLYDGDYPSADDLLLQDTLDRVYLYSSNAPDVVVADSSLYFVNNSRLRSLSLTDRRMTATTSSLNSVGRPALFHPQNGVRLVRTQGSCDAHDNFICFDWHGFYEAFTLNGFAAVDRTFLKDEHYYNVDWFYGPRDAFVINDGRDWVLSLNTSGEIAAFDTVSSSLRILADVNDCRPDIGTVGIHCLVSSPSANLVVVAGPARNRFRALAFDKDWTFAGSAELTFPGFLMDLSEFVYDSASDRFVYAYSSMMADYYNAPRVFVQSLKVDVAVDVPTNNSDGLPLSFDLRQNYPNPFNASTQIEFELPGKSNCKITVFDVLGRRVRVVLDEVIDAGTHRVIWDGKDQAGRTVASGVYFYRLQTAVNVSTRKMMLLK